MDDTAAYQGYETRLFRDSRSNTVQIYLDRTSGRTVLLWADALDESAGFTTRDAEGNPARLEWEGTMATVADSGPRRSITFQLRANTPDVTLGAFLLGSMRVERDLQYAKAELRPFSAPPFVATSESTLVANIARLPAAEQQREASLLDASSVTQLRSRLTPAIQRVRSDSGWTVRVERPALDGRSHLWLDLLGNSRTEDVQAAGNTVRIRARSGRSVILTVRVTTDGAPLTPIARSEIFNSAFLDFLSRARSEGAASERYRRLEREVRSVELLSSSEKLMAGLPNYATYFGRDALMTALMMRSIWTPTMSERVIASVLAKLGPNGDVSHEEALGEQAIREHADEYNALFAAEGGIADSSLTKARYVLRNIRRTRENYHMMDDEFQLPVLEALYLADRAMPASRKRAFLLDTANGGTPHVVLMLREMALVATEAGPFAQNAVATNLVGFVKSDSTHWRSASWRDSDVGYANGRFAMDINAIWVPHALHAIETAITSLHALGFTDRSIDSLAPEIGRSPLGRWMHDSTSLHQAIERWRGARKLFEVRLGPREIASDIRARLAALPPDERRYWEGVMSRTHAGNDSLTFLALSLDANGKPIRVVNTDPATDIFLTDYTSQVAKNGAAPRQLMEDVRPFVRDYPVGLFVSSIGPVVANDAYATPSVWEAFRKEEYHSPRVVWGREVSLYLLGLANQISAADERAGHVANRSLAPYVRSLRTALDSVLNAVTASHLQHNEVWSYRISDGRLLPARYGTSSDVQLWSTADLAVQFALARLSTR